ncbi:hypothetical protein [Spirosoma spitsbergense]|uniref:hypothetical protein n=1 Tax=Spirosoma spitsbergense TaxID=431554 RepID=UPI0012FB8515|nr:hypothetical protein [Spirosoma spitsbergense]
MPYTEKQLNKLFATAIRAANSQTWTSILAANDWQSVLPLPTLPTPLLALGGEQIAISALSASKIHRTPLREQWEPKATEWLQRTKDLIARRSIHLEQLVGNLLPKIQQQAFEVTERRAVKHLFHAVKDWTLEEFLYEPPFTEDKDFPEDKPARYFYYDFVIQLFSQLSVSVKAAGPAKDLLPQYTSFEELFKDPTDIAPCVKVLHQYEAGKSKKGFKKFVVLAWIDWLYDKKKIRTNSFEIVAPILTKELDGFTVSKRTYYDTAKGSKDANLFFKINIPH